MAATWTIPADERRYLRDLARKQAEYAALPVMAERKKMWYALNDAKPGHINVRPPFIIETWTFNRDFLPDSLLRCQANPARAIEQHLLKNIRNHELIDDDKVIHDTFQINWFTHINQFGVEIPTEKVEDAQGVKTGYRFLHPIKNLKEDFHLLRPAECRVDVEKTLAWQAYLEELFDGILRVELHTNPSFGTMLTHRAIELMGMEAYFMAMYDDPDSVHRLMAYLRDNALRMMHWAEDNQLLRVNNGNHDSFGSSCNFTTALPAARIPATGGVPP